MIISQYVSVYNFVHKWVVNIILSITFYFFYEVFWTVTSSLHGFSVFKYNILAINWLFCLKNVGIWYWFQNLNALLTIHSILIFISIFLLVPLL
jgi:hypothetical protein